VLEQSSELRCLISQLESFVTASQQGLPEPVFLLISRLTPLLGVDLLIQDALGHTLLTWRHDAHYGPGWHVPGGILRYKKSQRSSCPVL
jgi:colanic acid biosynthesis protein WcaH